MGQLKKTNIYITGNRPPMENVVFGSPLTVTTEITDSEENQKHTWYKLTTPNPSSGNIHSYRSAKIEFTTTEDNIEVEFKIKAQTNWDGSVSISALDYYTQAIELSPSNPKKYIYLCNRATAAFYLNDYTVAEKGML